MALDEGWDCLDIDAESDHEEKNVTVESLPKAASSGSLSDYDFCEDFKDVKKNVSADSTRSRAESSSQMSDFDLIDELNDVDTCSSDESASKEESSSQGSDFEFDGVEGNAYAESMISEAESASFDEASHVFEKTRCPTAAYHKVRATYFKYHSLTNPYNNLPIRDVLKLHALPFLPAKSLIKFRSVSKGWNGWITSPFLAHKQSYSFHKMSGYFYQGNDNSSFLSLCKSDYGVPTPSLSFLPEEVSIRSSCNGLLLCKTMEGNNMYYVCNPATKKWKILPPPHYYHGEDPAIVLAFEPSVLNMEAHYQIVCAVPMPHLQIFCFETYSSVTNSWNDCNALCPELEGASLKNNGVYFNGTAYWETTSNEVLAFNLKDEIHGVFPLPSERALGGVIAQAKGELCYICAPDSIGSVVRVDFYGGMNMDLKRSVHFDVGTEHGCPCWVLPSIDEDTVMVFVGGAVYSCNLNHKDSKVVEMDGDIFPGAKYLPYVNSLVSIA